MLRQRGLQGRRQSVPGKTPTAVPRTLNRAPLRALASSRLVWQAHLGSEANAFARDGSMSESGSNEIYFNPWDEAFRANPYPHYKSLYGRPPYFLNLFMPMMLVANYADVAAALRDHEH